jgi:hypothetical protein
VPAGGAAARFRFDYPEGRRFTYRLDYRSQSAALVSQKADAQSFTGQADLGADLVLRGYGAEGGHALVGLSLEKLTKHELVMLGQSVFPDDAAADAALTGHEAMVELAPGGEVLRVSFRPDDPSLFKNFVQVLVGELQVTVREGDTWTLDEPTLRGVAQARYQVASEDAKALRLSKERLRYLNLVGVGDMGATSTLSSSFAVSLLRAGQLEKLSGHEKLQGLDAAGAPRSSEGFDLELTLINQGPFEASRARVAQATQAVAPAQGITDPNAEAKFRVQQLDGLTEELLMANLRIHAAGGVIPRHNHFLIQAVALLELHPELCAKLAALIKEPGAGLAGSALMLDLLAATGTPEAQAAMRDALASSGVRATRYYDNLFSRLSLLGHPNVETVRFVEDSYREASGDRRTTTMFVLGATAGALHRNGGESDAAAPLQRLRSDLASAQKPTERADLLVSLGNAGVTDFVSTVVPYANSDSTDVRWAAAKALRKTQTPEAESALLTLAADSQVKVQLQALDVLQRFKLDGPARAQLCAAVRDGRLDMHSYNAFVTLLAPYVNDDAQVRATFQFLLTRPVVDREIFIRIQTLLGPS